MVQSLKYWCEVYERNKETALCLDIETQYFNGPISVVGLYRPRDGPIECQQFVAGRDLTRENLIEAMKDCTILITYNGKRFDVPKIKQEFPGVIPDSIPIVDLYLFAVKLNLKASLKVLENTFNIDRLDPRTKRRGIAIKLWKRFQTYGDQNALALLLDYNKQDTVNMYPLAEEFVHMIY